MTGSAAYLPDDLDHATRLARLDRLAGLMDSAVRVPGTRFRIGLDSLVGLVPGVGDTLALLPAAWILGQAWKMGAPAPVLGRMALNTGIDWALGTVPLVGDLFDVGFKANRRNVALLRGHLEKQKGPPRRTAPEFLPGANGQPTSSSPEKK